MPEHHRYNEWNDTTEVHKEVASIVLNPLEVLIDWKTFTEFVLDQIVSSGAIQLQVVSTLQSDEQSSYDWTISLKDEKTLAFQLKFGNPDLISSTGIRRDELRIIFVKTSLLMECRDDMLETRAGPFDSQYLPITDMTVTSVELPP